MTASKRPVSTYRISMSIGPPATPRCSMIPSSLKSRRNSTAPPGATRRPARPRAGPPVYRPPRDRKVLDDSLVFEVPQNLNRAARRHQALEALVLGVVQVDELEAVEAQELQAAPDGAAHLLPRH